MKRGLIFIAAVVVVTGIAVIAATHMRRGQSSSNTVLISACQTEAKTHLFWPDSANFRDESVTATDKDHVTVLGRIDVDQQIRTRPRTAVSYTCALSHTDTWHVLYVSLNPPQR